jgi:hypothetical protein
MQYKQDRNTPPWWKFGKNQTHEALFGTWRTLEHNQQQRHDMNLHHMRSYSNRDAAGLLGADYADSYTDARLRLNIVRAVIDTAIAFIGSNKPRPFFKTDDGNYSARNRAKGLNDFTAGQFHASKQYIRSHDVFRDGGIAGTGFQCTYPDLRTKKVCADRVFFDDIQVDDREAREGSPREVFRHKEVDKSLAKELWGLRGDALENSGIVRLAASSQVHRQITDPVSVVEVWRTPSYPGAKDGRHVMAIEKQTILDEPWELYRNPLSVWRWSPASLGYWGVGLAELLNEIQLEINYLLMKIQSLMTLATSQVWLEAGSKINVAAMGNRDWSVNKYDGKPPIFMAIQAVSPEYFHHVDRLYNRAFEITGISQMQAESKKPPGLESGKAIQEFNDIGTRRFLHTGQRWEEWHMDVAEMYIESARHIDKHAGPYIVKAEGKNTVREIPWQKVSLDDNKYVMKVFPTNFLPATPAGQMDTLERLGSIDPQIQRQMVGQLEFPDLEAATSMVNAPFDMCDLLLEEMLDKGNYRPPEPFMPLKLFLDRMRLQLLRADIGGHDEEKLDLVRQFLSEAAVLISQTEAPGMAAAPPAQGVEPNVPNPQAEPAPQAGPNPAPATTQAA